MRAIGGANTWRVGGWALLGALLLTPLLAMQFTGEVAWSGGDFVAAALLLAALGLAIELSFRLLHRPRQRLVAAGIAIAVVGLVWAELAVGLFH